MNRRKLKVDTLQEAARVATMAALTEYPGYSKVPTENLTLGTFWKDDAVVFELYLAADHLCDALVLTTANVNAYSGEIIAVQIHHQAWTRLAHPSNPADA